MEKDFDHITYATVSEKTALKYPDKVAFIYKDRQLTFRQLRDAAIRLAKAFVKAGIKKEDRVAILMTNIPEWVIVRNAIARVGAWLVPINTRYKTSELEHLLTYGEVNALVLMDSALGIDFVELVQVVCPALQNAAPGNGCVALDDFPHLKTVVCLGERDYPGMYNFNAFIDSGEKIADQTLSDITDSIQPHDVNTLMFTAGTTGKPKGVLTTHYQFLRVFTKVCERLGLTSDDVILGAPPFFTNFGLHMGLSIAEISGASIVGFESFDPGQILEGIEAHKISMVAATPAMFHMLLHHEKFSRDKVKSIRVGDYGGAPMTPAQVLELIDEFGLELFSMYGMTETTGLITVCEKDAPIEIVATTVGKNFNDDCEFKIVDVDTREEVPPGTIGEIVTRGWHVTPGYYNEPELTANARDKEGWFSTGDLGSVDEEGNLKFGGRIKELIISGGLNIDPIEIENFILEHPSVESAHIVGLPDRRMGELVGAFIKLKTGMRCTEDDIRSFCDGKIGKYKIPKYITFIEEPPRNAVGKVQKFKLQELGVVEFGLQSHIDG